MFPVSLSSPHSHEYGLVSLVFFPPQLWNGDSHTDIKKDNIAKENHQFLFLLDGPWLLVKGIFCDTRGKKRELKIIPKLKLVTILAFGK